MRRRRGLPHAGASARRRWGTGPAARHVQAPLREERRRCPRQAQRKSPASLLEGGALFQPLKRKRRSSALFQPGLPKLGDGGPGFAGHLGEGGSGRVFLARSRKCDAKPRIHDIGLHATLLERDLIEFSRSEEHTSELQSLMRISYAVFCLKTKTT